VLKFLIILCIVFKFFMNFNFSNLFETPQNSNMVKSEIMKSETTLTWLWVDIIARSLLLIGKKKSWRDTRLGHKVGDKEALPPRSRIRHIYCWRGTFHGTLLSFPSCEMRPAPNLQSEGCPRTEKNTSITGRWRRERSRTSSPFRKASLACAPKIGEWFIRWPLYR
jgi:hypothetical protein